MATGVRKDPFGAYNFRVELDGITRAGFRECAGLDSTQNPIDYREGTDPLTARRLPGLNTYSNLTLQWGVTDDAELWAWRKSAMDGKVQRKNGSIVLLDDTGEEKVRWNFINAWPTKWTGPDFNASQEGIAIERLEIVHEGLTKA